jgi:hypothetical protein
MRGTQTKQMKTRVSIIEKYVLSAQPTARMTNLIHDLKSNVLAIQNEERTKTKTSRQYR